MASRRVRIKGIANIPQRRKPVTTTEQELENQEESNDNRSKEIEDNPNLNVTADSHDNVIDVTDQVNKDIPAVDSGDQDTQISKASEIIEKNGSVCGGTQIVGLSALDHVLPANKSKCVKEKQDKEPCASINNVINTKQISAENEKQPEKVPTIRRKFLKPPVRVNALNRNVRGGIEEAKIDKENVQENANVDLNEIEISTNNVPTALVIHKTQPSGGPLTSDLGAGKLGAKDSGKSGSDTEYHQPPASPSKILNRRIKAIPKLHQRRTSFSIGSASESEDDTRRSCNRIRNDSVCSANSGANESHATSEARSPTRKESTVAQRKSRRNEQTRKLAEARREFNMKFNNGKPDKQKLTMIDLIFYNPTTSPMSHNKRQRKSTCSSETSESKPKTEEEMAEDDPPPASESDNDLPAPQLKVGPNGEIVVDEKSLIIENAETKKGREALQHSEVVNGDEDTSYGLYKRIKRTKEWSKDETLRFYKALNTIGTDFTLMCELFPNRTRRELKMKFKKEEKLNQALINKAVMQPSEFDMTELRKDLELETRRIEENKKRAEETKIIREAAAEHRKKLKKNLRVKGIDGTFMDSPPIIESKPKTIRKRKKTTYDVIKGGINSILSESDEDGDLHETISTTNKENDCNENEDEENKASILKPTRCGILPKVQMPDSSDVLAKHITKRRKADGEVLNSDKDQEDLEPGSIIIVKSKNTTEQLVYKVYIVTDNQTKQQIDLTPNVLKNLTGISGDKLDGELCGIQTHNILTISTQKFSDIAELNMNALESNNSIEEQSKDAQLTKMEINEVPLVKGNSSLNSRNIEMIGDRIIFPFDESLSQAVGSQNITVSHEDNKMIVVTEN